jgi:hypothetical protein
LLQRSRNPGFSGHSVKPLPCLLHPVCCFYKWPAEGGLGDFLLFALGLSGLWLDSFASGLFGVGSFGKGKELMKEKNCREIAEWKRMAKEGYQHGVCMEKINIGLRKESQRKNFNMALEAKEKPKRTWDSAR